MSSEKRICIINGPNLNLLGSRDPNIYGTRTFEEFFEELKTYYPGVSLDYFQSNSEGSIIDQLHQCGFDHQGIVLNAGAYTHYSIAIRDAIDAIPSPVIEVHISDIYSREPFRWKNCLKDVCHSSIVGKGLNGYKEAVNLIMELK